MFASTINTALLSFSLGPVQSFIEAAKTTRDLWAGSYLLSWLSVAAMRPLLVRDDVQIISPSVAGNPLLTAYAKAAGFTLARPFARPPLVEDVLLPCLPNRFLARVPADDAASLAVEVNLSCRNEWARIASVVHEQLKPSLDGLHLGWDSRWPAQVDSVFEVRVVVLSTVDQPLLARLAFGGATGWTAEFDVISGMLDAARSVRHVPAYHPGEGDVPQKCTLLGTYEQLGPAKLTESKDFWVAARAAINTRGGSIRSGERLSAISLIKRFVWAHDFSHRLPLPGRREDKLELLRFTDTATIAARVWLGGNVPLDLRGLRLANDREWNGQWLHWPAPEPARRPDDPDPEPACPRWVWDEIQRKKHADGPPPAYYAVLMLDGDGLGKLLRGGPEREKDGWDVGADRPTEISRMLTRFALTEVERVVEQHFGELIYTGGDDTLALIPLSKVVACAKELSDRYRVIMNNATVSGAVAVVHYKEDLRFALQEARNAERAAKRAGRNCLALTICRRGGEHSRAVIAWDQVDGFNRVASLFIDPGISDRWVYKLREVQPTLDGLPVQAVRAELRRLLDRIESEASRDQLDQFQIGVMSLFEAKCGRGDGLIDRTDLSDFVTLCQSASFLARGRDR